MLAECAECLVKRSAELTRETCGERVGQLPRTGEDEAGARGRPLSSAVSEIPLELAAIQGGDSRTSR
jgi:hypothetical protein